MSNIKSSILLLLFGVIFLTGCNGNEVNLKDGDTYLTEEMDEVISDYIIQKYSSINSNIEKHFEVHRIYGTSESNGVLSVYMWSYYGGFNKSTGLESRAGHSLPAVIQLREKDNKYSVVKYIEPQDGNLYQSSLKKMFPEKYLRIIHEDSGSREDLQSKMDEKVKQWLEMCE
ncbi:hypothetical protein [Bacillus sp. FJAT-29937]|uniref:hypothetical protein n=1 Tax=Bacillus sp. FJAT-29937 TaxID=1720553 RepID=UPI000836E14A|nr:hypothetical protein [Bacillus sp. FJAT-29937]